MLGDRIIGQVWDVDPDWKLPGSVNAFNEAMRERLAGYLQEKLVGRPDLLAKCLPDYPPLAKRFVVDAGWLDALKSGKAHLIDEAVAQITPSGVVTVDGTAVDCDVIVLATGFRANDFLWPMEVIGRGGKSIRDAWSVDGGRAYLGLTVPEFPNLFMHYGPNSNPRAGTPPMFAEMQMRYILRLLVAMAEHGCKSVEPRRDVYDRFNRDADRILARSIWMDSRQKSYYTNRFGRVATNSPWKTIDYWRWLLQPNLSDYVTRS
jgi:4-hydroxyacetophenone monooxygenase